MFRISRHLFAIVVIMAIFSLEAISGELRTLDLQSRDIACSSCALRIKRTVGGMEGVKEITVSAGTKKIYVEYDESRVSENQIIQKISDLGFKVKRETI